MPGFSARMPGGNAGLMFFDVTYTDPAQVPRLLAHAITLASANGGPGTPALTDPVPVGCKQLPMLRPPLVGHGWLAGAGCCTPWATPLGRGGPADQRRPAHGSEQFAIDYMPSRPGPEPSPLL